VKAKKEAAVKAEKDAEVKAAKEAEQKIKNGERGHGGPIIRPQMRRMATDEKDAFMANAKRRLPNISRRKPVPAAHHTHTQNPQRTRTIQH
jgi:hypothetical protein